MKNFLLVVIVLLGAVALSATARGSASAGSREVALTIRHSRFSSSEIRVRRGDRVRFVVRNSDPIDHELIVGHREVQDRHESGTEPHHGARDGEVSVPLFETEETSFTFEERGTYLFGCHLPGHWAYGMQGTIVVS